MLELVMWKETELSFELILLCSGWWWLLAAAESRRVPGDSQRRGLLPLHPHLRRIVRPLSYHLRLPPHQDAQTEAKRDFGKRGKTPQGLAAPAAPAASAQTPRHHQDHQPAACCRRCQEGKECVTRINRDNLDQSRAWFTDWSPVEFLTCRYSSKQV